MPFALPASHASFPKCSLSKMFFIQNVLYPKCSLFRSGYRVAIIDQKSELRHTEYKRGVLYIYMQSGFTLLTTDLWQPGKRADSAGIQAAKARV